MAGGILSEVYDRLSVKKYFLVAGNFLLNFDKGRIIDECGIANNFFHCPLHMLLAPHSCIHR